MTDLSTAIRSRESDFVREMLASGADPNEIDDETGESMLAIAAQLGDFEIVDQLLEAGADPNRLSATLWPLEAAAGAGHEDIVERLLFAEADIDAGCEVANRPGRLEPRAVKRRPKPYKLMQKPRTDLRRQLRKRCT